MVARGAAPLWTAGLTTFVDDYKLQHKAKPGQFPLELGDENKGLWWEFFMSFAVDRED